MRQEAEPAGKDIDEVAPGVLRLQLPIRMPGLGHVNCYALEDERGVALVDPGLPGPKAWKSLLERVAAAGFGVKDIHTIVVTHSHIDHFGMAGKLRKDTGADVVTHASFRTWFDPAADGEPAADRPRLPWQQSTPWGGEHPRPPLKIRLRYTLLRPLARRWMATPAPSTRLQDADTIRLAKREWVALHTPGHTPDHLCLLDPVEGILLSGDHVLPTITPHISGLDAGPDPLAAFFASLDRMHELNGVGTVLPAHGHPFTDVAARAKDIRRHHEERLAKLRDAAAELSEATVHDLSERLFSERAWGPMAESETYAHLEHLRLAGETERRARPRDGVLLYRLTG
ncbi:MAG: MBL fold metallo-hydrolase [Acidimicrobiales bacterium]